MSRFSEVLAYNQEFVDQKEYQPFETDKLPNKKMVVVTCMDTRLIELLPNAMNIKNGDAKVIKNAGAIVSDPFGSVMKSILVAIHELGAEEVFIVGHHGCGMNGLNASTIFESNEIDQDKVKTLKDAGFDIEKWYTGFDSVEESVQESVNVVKKHPLLPERILVHGLVISPETGKLDVVVKGG